MPDCVLSDLKVRVVQRRQEGVAFTGMSLRRADAANGSFGVDKIATAISALGRKGQFAASGSSRWPEDRRRCSHHAHVRRQPCAYLPFLLSTTLRCYDWCADVTLTSKAGRHRQHSLHC